MNQRKRILVVDDQRDIRDVTALVLTGAGYDVDTAASGEEALARAGDGGLDLVLLDINMPEMDGWETLRLLRVDDATQGLPVVMFSVKGELFDKVQSLQQGATGHVVKPFAADDLLARVRQALESG
jgi:DNA-binding response OmpR family regulator